MAKNSTIFLKTMLGDNFFEDLKKFELYKPGTRTVVDPLEIKAALSIVPKTLMSYLIKELSPMEIGEVKELKIPFLPETLVRVRKLERDVYSGEIEEKNSKINAFQFRSLPGVGLVLMSTFELYDINELEESKMPEKSEVNEELVNKLIDERLHMHELIGKVIDKKIMEKEAINELLMQKLSKLIEEQKEQKEKPIEEPKVTNKLTLEKFLDNINKKRQQKEFFVKIDKSDVIDCPDCKQTIFKNDIFSNCLCFGDSKKVFFKKSNDGIKIRFSKSWEQDNIEMFLEIMRKNHG